MDVKKSYFNFFAAHGAKQKVLEVITKGIENWKQKQAWTYHPGTDPYTGDTSGCVSMVPNKKIGEICKTDMEVLKAYTGDSEATYVSGCGLHYLRVADRIGQDVNDCLSNLRGLFIKENATALFETYNIEHDEDWTEDDIYLTLDEAMIQEDYGLNFDWMQQKFPEYEIDDEDMPARNYIFFIYE